MRQHGLEFVHRIAETAITIISFIANREGSIKFEHYALLSRHDIFHGHSMSVHSFRQLNNVKVVFLELLCPLQDYQLLVFDSILAAEEPIAIVLGPGAIVLNPLSNVKIESLTGGDHLEHEVHHVLIVDLLLAEVLLKEANVRVLNLLIFESFFSALRLIKATCAGQSLHD